MEQVEANVFIKEENNMYKIETHDINKALESGINLMNLYGVETPSRNDSTLELPEPIMIVYNKPFQRVLINKDRDCNHFFHLMESMWMLAGRNDVTFLNEFNSNMKNYSDNGETFNGAYGHRARYHFYKDQFAGVVKILKADPYSRQAVVQLWDPDDLKKKTLDKCCNMSIVFRIRADQRLDMTVYNRSNDMIYGAFGANAVHFSIIHEYIAAHLNIAMGKYYQVSNAFHVYTDVNSKYTGKGAELWEKLNNNYKASNIYADPAINLVTMLSPEITEIDMDIEYMFRLYDERVQMRHINYYNWRSSYFKKLIIPTIITWFTHKEKGAKEALKIAEAIEAEDWKAGCKQWLIKRIK